MVNERSPHEKLVELTSRSGEKGYASTVGPTRVGGNVCLREGNPKNCYSKCRIVNC